MFKKNKSLLLGALSLMLIGCDDGTSENQITEEDTVKLYLLGSYEKESNSEQIKLDSIILENTPFINYSEILSYDKSQYLLELSNDGFDKIEELSQDVYGVPFAVVAGAEIMYTGYFIPTYSSYSCDCIIIDPLFSTQPNSFTVQLGYPDAVAGIEIKDNRNDERLLEIFREDNKLIE